MIENDFLAKRKLTVHYIYINDKRAPLIHLRGQWLRELGFTTGSYAYPPKYRSKKIGLNTTTMAAAMVCCPYSNKNAPV